jgi:hypothetical protein
MPGNPLVRFDEGRVGRTSECRPLSYSTGLGEKNQFILFLHRLPALGFGGSARSAGGNQVSRQAAKEGQKQNLGFDLNHTGVLAVVDCRCSATHWSAGGGGAGTGSGFSKTISQREWP